MKLVTTSLAVGALVVSLSGAAFAQVSLDPNAQGSASGKAGAKAHTDRAKTGGSATTGAGAQTPGGSAGAGASGGVSGQGGAGGGSLGIDGGPTGKVRGSGTLGN